MRKDYKQEPELALPYLLVLHAAENAVKEFISSVLKQEPRSIFQTEHILQGLKRLANF